MAAVRARYCYRRVHVLLRCEGRKEIQKRMYNLYRAEPAAQAQQGSQAVSAEESCVLDQRDIEHGFRER